MQNLLPIVATHDDTDVEILDYIRYTLSNNSMDTIVFAAPYISSYFIDILANSNSKLNMGIVDKKVDDTTYKAMDRLEELRKQGRIVEIKQRPLRIKNPEYNPKNSRSKIEISTPTMHMKVIIPYYRNSENKLYARCAFTGSVNFTANGIRNNDEMLVVLQDDKNIQKCARTLNRLWSTSIPYDKNNPQNQRTFSKY